MLISVIVPIFNVSDYIEKCVKSIVNQTYFNIEVLLIDDGSTDNSGYLCDLLAAKDKRVRVIHQQNKGVSAARNLGVQEARGDYVTFVDGDDWLDEDYFSLVVPILEKYRPSILVNPYLIDKQDGQTINKFSVLDRPIYYKDREQFIKELMVGRYFTWGPVASFYEAKLCKQCEFPENIVFGEDLMFKFSFAKIYASSFSCQSIAKYHYFMRSTSAVNSYPLAKRIDDLKVFEFIMQEVSKKLREEIYGRYYVPRLIQYNRNLSSERSDGENCLKTVIRGKLNKNLVPILLGRNIKFSLKWKAFICFIKNLELM